ncbi:long-chain-fatty-acid--CoA ligase [Streptacidiphilus jiangxiensis]|uniref:Long-chain acyl-CoA synthetase n=1 Tax=Streptacidiphilus jiangxiensis TaxID=235985 RepID=A0A1H7YX75_STRJI|nr:long-chain fatty acid--CoA ligase [Streptacidiphilus jiangxiensis]SEM50882.1 long-chain acyl-CoA synthetase [Streptacidiphilus jiangxiensis]
MTNLASLLIGTAATGPGRTAVRQDDVALGYAELDDLSARTAALLRSRGVRPGDRVALIMPNIVQFPVAYYGILRAGAVVVPLNPLLKAREIAFALGDSGAQIVLTAPSSAAEAREAVLGTGGECLVVEPGEDEERLRDHAPLPGCVDRADDDIALILYTSGTTGTPKGAQLTHRNLLSNTATTVETLFRAGPDDVLFGGLPLFHAFGQTCALNTAVAAGATLTLLPRFDPQRALEIMRRDAVTVFLGVPTMYTALLQAVPAEADAPAALRLAVSGGAALPVEVLHGFERRFGVPVLEGYGLSETSPVAAFNPPDRPRKPGSIGLPVRGVQLRLVGSDGGDAPDGEIGEIAVRGENVMAGYRNRPEATAEALRDGWFLTGDLAVRDAEGYYFVVDRKKDMIIRGGYNVYPREIEEVLYEHPAVAEAAVVGVPHAVHGEEVAAVVRLKPGAQAGAEELRAHVRARVAAYKYPRVVRLVEELPKGPTGKILKREIVVPPH